MKILLKLLITSTFLFNFTQSNAQDKSSNKVVQTGSNISNYQLLNPEDFKRNATVLKGLIIDVRTPQEYKSGHIENAQLVNFLAEDFLDKMNLVERNQPIFIYCKSGNRSAKAIETLLNNGFKNIYELKGGIIAWQNKNLPILVSENHKIDENKTISVEDFLSLKKNHENLLIEFSTTWCAPCRLMKPIIEDIKRKYKQTVFVKNIDLDENQALGQKLNLMGVPVFILFKNGKEIWRHTGLMKKQDLEQELNRL